MSKIQATLLSDSSRSPTRVCIQNILTNLSHVSNWMRASSYFRGHQSEQCEFYPWVFSSFGIPNHSIKWLALTPPALVQAHLGFDMETIASLPKTKPIVVGPASSWAPAYRDNDCSFFSNFAMTSPWYKKLLQFCIYYNIIHFRF